MKKYGHIQEWERRQIYVLLQEWRDKQYISEKLGRHKSTIGREIKRNSHHWVYQPAHAQREYEIRRSEINKWRRKLKKDSVMLAEIRKRMMEDRRAPHSISGRHKEAGRTFVCTATILRYIHEREPELEPYLKYKKGYKKHGFVETRGSPKHWYKLITERDPIIEERERIGDLEVDTIHSGWSDRKWWVVTVVDRKTKYLRWGKVKRRTAKAVWDVLIKEIKKIPKEKRLSITADNGKEFYDFARVEKKLKTPVYFAHPYASYERWTNEHTNGMLRVFFPKKTDFSKVSENEIQQAIAIINRKPRKSLGYLWLQL